MSGRKDRDLLLFAEAVNRTESRFAAAVPDLLVRDSDFREAFETLAESLQRETTAKVARPALVRRVVERLAADALLGKGDHPTDATTDRLLLALPRDPKEELATLASPLAERPREALAAARLNVAPSTPEPLARLLALAARELSGTSGDSKIWLDPCVGDGSVLSAAPEGAFGMAGAYLDLRLSGGRTSLALAEALATCADGTTLRFDLFRDANDEAVRRVCEARVGVVVSDLRHVRGAAPKELVRRTEETYGLDARPRDPGALWLRWASDRLRQGPGAVVLALQGEIADDPAYDALRAALSREFGLVRYLDLGALGGVLLLARGANVEAAAPHRATAVLEALAGIERLDDLPWQSTHDARIWGVGAPEASWEGWIPLHGAGRTLFDLAAEGVAVEIGDLEIAPETRRMNNPGTGRSFKVYARPFAPRWVRGRRAWPALAPAEPILVTFGEPFSVALLLDPPTARFGEDVWMLPARTGTGNVRRENVAAWALARFREAYGAGVVERDVFDYAVALLHHPDYRERFRERLRRETPRIPLLSSEVLSALAAHPDAPPIGPGTALGAGWSDVDRFEPGTVPEYDDPFASPYAREGVDPDFLRFAALGAALGGLHLRVERLLPYPLERVAAKDEPALCTEGLRLSRDRTRLVVNPELALEGIPTGAFDVRLGKASPLEWVVESGRVRTDRKTGITLDPNRSDDPEYLLRLVGQSVAFALELQRLTEIVETVPLPD